MTVVVNNNGQRFKMITVRLSEAAYLATKAQKLSFSEILEDAIQNKLELEKEDKNG